MGGRAVKKTKILPEPHRYAVCVPDDLILAPTEGFFPEFLMKMEIIKISISFIRLYSEGE